MTSLRGAPLASGGVACGIAFGIAVTVSTGDDGFSVVVAVAVGLVCVGTIALATGGLRASIWSAPVIWLISFMALLYIAGIVQSMTQARPARGTFMAALELTALAFPFGVLAATVFTPKRNLAVERFTSRAAAEPKSFRPGLLSYGALLFCTVVAALYWTQVKTIPLVAFLEGSDAGTLEVLREDSFKLLQSPIRPAFTIVRDLIFPLLVAFAVASFSVTRSRSWQRFAIVSFTIGFSYATLSFARLPPLALILVVVVCWRLCGGRGLVRPLRRLALVAMFVFPVVATVPTAGSVPAAIQKVGERVYAAPANILYYYFEVTPQYIPHQHGRTMGVIVEIAGFDQFDIGNAVSRYLNPHSRVSSGSANAGFPGSLYVDFGLVGVAVGAFLTGFAVQLLQYALSIRQKDVLNVAIYAFLCYQIILLNILPLPSIMLYSGLPFVVGLGVWQSGKQPRVMARAA